MTKGASALFDPLLVELTAVESNLSLREDRDFGSRADAIDRIEFHVLDRIAAIDAPSDDLLSLKQRAEQLLNQLTAIDQGVFQRLRGRIASGTLRGDRLRRELERYASPSARGFDHLDGFVDGLLRVDTASDVTLRPREPEMVYYQPTPARVILELAAQIRPDDVFCDLGSGLGHVCILVHLLTGARTCGVEFEPVYCDVARRSAACLNLSGVEILTGDAREVDCPDGTVFYMYTPFRGTIMERVLEKLERSSRGREIQLCTYGGCTQQVAAQPWLKRVGPAGGALGLFARAL